MNRRAALWLIAAGAAVACLFLWLRPAAPALAPAALADSTAASVATPRTLAWVVARGRVLRAPELTELREGDPVRLSVVSDTADELHLHGYDLEQTLRPNEPAVIEFVATRSGHFELELHRAGLVLGALDALPP